MVNVLIGLVILAAIVAGLALAGLAILTRDRRPQGRPSPDDPQNRDWIRCRSADCQHRNVSHARFCARCGRPLRNLDDES